MNQWLIAMPIYNIYDKFSFEIIDKTEGFIRSAFLELDFFKSENRAANHTVIEIGDFKPVTTNTHCIDHIWYIRKNFLYADFGRYRFNLVNPFGDNTLIQFFCKRRLVPPRFHLTVEHLLFKGILRELLLSKLHQIGWYFLHASAVSIKGEVVVVAGAGGVGKTAFWLEALKHDAMLYGDDFILINDEGKVVPFPNHIKTLNYRLENQNNRDNLSTQDLMRWFYSVSKFTHNHIPIAGPKQADLLLMLFRSGSVVPPLEQDISDGMLSEKIYRNLLLEIYHNRLDSFLLMYQYVFPECFSNSFECSYKNALDFAFSKCEKEKLIVEFKDKSDIDKFFHKIIERL